MCLFYVIELKRRGKISDVRKYYFLHFHFLFFYQLSYLTGANFDILQQRPHP